MMSRIGCEFGLVCLLLAGISVAAAAQGYPGYPNTIMAPEPGTRSHHRSPPALQDRAAHSSLLGHEKFVAKLHRPRGVFAARGSSGVVLPTPLPRTKLIPPEGGGAVATHPLPQQQSPTFVPGAPSLGAIPNLTHGPETFQDRASRCAFQQGLNNVPGSLSTQYMGACVN